MKYSELIQQMTLTEKCAILSGKDEWSTREVKRLNIPSMTCSDGPHGIRRQAGAGDHLGLNASLPATCFPTAASIANSWDVNLGEAVGKALGEEVLSIFRKTLTLPERWRLPMPEESRVRESIPA